MAVVGLVVWAPSALAVDVTWSAFGTAGTNGWYVTDVWINWTLTNINPPLTQDCSPVHLVQNAPGQTATCTAKDASGTTVKTTTAINIDRTPPAAVASPDRVADGSGFYNHAVTVTWSGTDGTSGIAACTSTPYSGPDGNAISLTGTCRDKAGNVSAAVPFAFNYDSTPPLLTNVIARPDDAAARLAWQASGASTIVVMRTASGAGTAQSGVVYSGTADQFKDSGLKNGTTYSYLVQAVDLAGNASSDSVSVTPDPDASTKHLLSPGSKSRLTRPPMFRWREIRVASYYNLQLFRHGKKILSAWPTKPHYKLRRAWTYRGHRYRLGKGTYRWYLWGGYGRRSEHRYGHLLGKRTFTIA
jgi:hypothetical protein